MSNNQPSKRGGKRPNSGRKKTGRINRVISITIPPKTFGRIEKMRGKISRSKFICSKLDDSMNEPSPSVGATE